MILALAGGVGGAKLAAGLAAALNPDDLRIVVNTGDDFEHLGLAISPDLDSVTYALAGINNPTLGWGQADETWAFMAALERLGGETWFRLGDRDLATHVLRTQGLKTKSLSSVTATLATGLGVRHAIIPMSDDPVRSMVTTDLGELDFQTYFVRHQSRPIFQSIRFAGIETAQPSEGFLAALADPDLDAIILCPSNPVLSIAPILALTDVRERLRAAAVPVVALSPFIGGEAVKGPAAKILRELNLQPDASGLIASYSDFLDGLVIDQSETAQPHSGTVEIHATDTLMRDRAGQHRVADEILRFSRALAARR